MILLAYQRKKYTQELQNHLRITTATGAQFSQKAHDRRRANDSRTKRLRRNDVRLSLSTTSVIRMGVDNGGGDSGDKSPSEFGAGDANANCLPPDFVI